MTTTWLSLHYFKNSSIIQSPADVKQQLLDEVATARIALAKSSSTPSFLRSRPSNLFVFSGPREIYWADNRTPVSDSLLHLNPGFVALENGIYLLHKKAGDTTLLYLKLIQENPRVRNRYIEPYKMFNGELSLFPQPGFNTLDLGQQKVYFSPIPFAISSFQLFSPEYFASSQLNPSLGFLLINLLWLGAALLLTMELLQRISAKYRWLPGAVILFCLGPVCTQLITSLVDDSKLNLEFFNFNSLTGLDLLIPFVLLWFSSFFYLVFRFYENSPLSSSRWKWLLFMAIAYNAVQYFFNHYDLLEINWFLPFLVIPLLKTKESSSAFSWNRTLFLLTLTFGWYFVFQKHQQHHLRDEQSLIAEKLAENSDPIAEYLIAEGLQNLEDRFGQEDSLKQPLTFLEENLFLGYLSKYTAIAIPDSIDQMDGFYFSFHNSNYRLQNRYNTAGFGFPELLANREFANYYERGFSTARFAKGRLFQSSGSYVYKKNLPNAYSQGDFLERNGHLHHIKRLVDETIVVSYPTNGYLHNFATATYMFLLALIGILPWILMHPKQLTGLQGRIQFSFLSLVILTVLVFGASMYVYISDQFDEKNQLSLSEKIRSVETELHSKLKGKSTWEQQPIENQLRKLAEIFFTDISLYDVDGKLIASSQPDIFTKGVLSTQMEPEAYRKLSRSGSNLVIQTESIGKLSYLSAYRPFTDEENQTIAYVNLPYFAKQLELNKQLSNFLVSTITALVLLTAIALTLAIFLASRITEPLKTIRLKLQAIDLKNENQQIDYNDSDEIGELVTAYNSKVKELIQKANQLAQSERESAWREMARQVAHEIKNPLTPIKLNAQLLQRNLDADDPAIQEKTRRFISGLIDQVNTLTKIANEFSNYASLPKAIETHVDLNEIVSNAISIMGHESVPVSTELPKSRSTVYADKDLMVRVINNLLKNAIHAIEEKTYTSNELGLISVSIVQKNGMAELTVEDNGTGIADEMKEKIFSPNFTTKSTGMGLGLAMVKQIIEHAGGSIWFESDGHSGTSFFIRIPLVDVKNS